MFSDKIMIIFNMTHLYLLVCTKIDVHLLSHTYSMLNKLHVNKTSLPLGFTIKVNQTTTLNFFYLIAKMGKKSAAVINCVKVNAHP